MINKYLQKKCVMVTGAGGSIGSELCRKICKFNPEQLILMDWAECPLYEIKSELKQDFNDISIISVLDDIKDKEQLENTFEDYKPNIVFHTAAYKHVPMMEIHPWKAVSNNIQGTLNIIESAKKFKVEYFVFISTDKAVSPTSVMGASKRICEMLVQNQSDIVGIIVRFGNVISSVGSVIPLFKKQIKDGGPITVTHPEVTRYFMTIPKACDLIINAYLVGNNREIFLSNTMESIKIDDIAKYLIMLSGKDIKIEYVGLRPGEKLFEELIITGAKEEVIISESKDIIILKGKKYDLKDLNILNNKIDELITISKSRDPYRIKDKLMEIINGKRL